MTDMPAINVELRDIANPEYRNALVAGGGKAQVPCLLIETDDKPQWWMYESEDIVRYLSELN